MSDEKIAETAARIVTELFTNGSGEHVDRLIQVRERDGTRQELGGWGRHGMEDRIARILRTTGLRGRR